MTYYQVKIKLKNMPVAYYRTVQVPSEISFLDLERVIQTVMDWSGLSLAVFRLEGGIVEIAHPIDARRLRGVRRSDTEYLSDYVGWKIEYIYCDEKCQWIHNITIEKEFEGDLPYPKMVNGKGYADLEIEYGSAFSFLNEIETARFDKEDIEGFNEDLRKLDIHIGCDVEGDKIPYNVVYSLSLAIFLPESIRLFIDPASGKIYSDKKNEYFPKAESVTDFIELGPETRYSFKYILEKALRKDRTLSACEKLKIKSSDPIGIYKELKAKTETEEIRQVLAIATLSAFETLEILNLDFAEEELGKDDSHPQIEFLATDLILRKNVCPHCGGMLSNPYPDTGSEMLEYRYTYIHPIVMTCVSCGRDVRIVPTDSEYELTYEGFFSPIDVLKTVFERMGGKGDRRAKADSAFQLYSLGDRGRSIEMAKSSMDSTDIYCRAIASSILYPEGMIGKEEIVPILKEAFETTVLPQQVDTVLTVIATELGFVEDLSKSIQEFIDLQAPTLQYCLATDHLLSILPPDNEYRAELYSILKKTSVDTPCYLGWMMSEIYCRCMAAYDIHDPDYVESFELKRNTNFGDEKTYVLSRYRRGMLNLDTDVEKAVKDFRGVLNKVIVNGMHTPAIHLRAVYAAIVAHHLGVRYKGQDLISHSARWMSFAIERGYMEKEDVDEYLDMFFKVALEDHSKEEIAKILKRNGFGTEIPNDPGEFDPSVMKHVMAQYRIHPY